MADDDQSQPKGTQSYGKEAGETGTSSKTRDDQSQQKGTQSYGKEAGGTPAQGK